MAAPCFGGVTMAQKIVQLTENARLHVYVSDICLHKTLRDGLLVIPGGGYSFVSMNREGEPVALEFCGRGMNCFVLEYSVKEQAKFPQPLQEAALAMKHIKEHAEEYHIDPMRVYAMGFSAGGHLCATLGSFWNREEVQSLPGMTPELAKPKGTVLIYPVITSGSFAHKGSFFNICGTTEPDREQLDRYSVEKQISEDTVPVFLVHTATDKTVPVENSLLLATALSQYEIPMELHIFPRGAHGLALANYITARNENEIVEEFSQWSALAWDWMKRS